MTAGSGPAPEDAALLAYLGEVAGRIDPVPEFAYELGRATFGLRRLDEEFAALVADSQQDAALVRGTAIAFRLLSFRSGALTVEVQVTGEGDEAAVLGELMWDGVDTCTLTVETVARDQQPVDVDGDGRFEFSPVPRTVIRFRVEAPDGRIVTTAWVRL